MEKEERIAVVLLSGGLDSAVTAAFAKSKGFGLHSLSINYGQRHFRELESAKKISRHLGVIMHKAVDFDLSWIGGSALTDANIPVPKNRNLKEIRSVIPGTYVPARNTIFLSLALGYAEAMNAKAIFIGANALDYSGYPDCRPEFLKAFSEVARLGTRTGVTGRPIEIRYPLVNLTKAQIIKRGAELNVPFELTWSCYRGSEKACGRCDSCLLRLKGFSEAGLSDPIDYEEES